MDSTLLKTPFQGLRRICMGHKLCSRVTSESLIFINLTFLNVWLSACVRSGSLFTWLRLSNFWKNGKSNQLLQVEVVTMPAEMWRSDGKRWGSLTYFQWPETAFIPGLNMMVCMSSIWGHLQQISVENRDFIHQQFLSHHHSLEYLVYLTIAIVIFSLLHNCLLCLIWRNIDSFRFQYTSHID